MGPQFVLTWHRTGEQHAHFAWGSMLIFLSRPPPQLARGYAAGDRVDMGHASRSRHVIWVLFGSTACSPRHFRQRETKHPGIVGPQETLLSRRHEGLVHPHRYCRRPQADHVFELRDAVSLNFDLLFTPLQQPAFKTNCFFLNANLFPRLFQRPALRYRHPDFGYFRLSEASFAN